MHWGKRTAFSALGAMIAVGATVGVVPQTQAHAAGASAYVDVAY